MEGWLEGIVGSVLILGTIGGACWVVIDARRQLARVGASWGLRRAGFAYEGQIDGYEVRLRAWLGGRRIPTPFRGVEIALDTGGLCVLSRLSLLGRDFWLGDPAVDHFVLRGDAYDLARLSPEVRQRFAELQGADLELQEGRLVVRRETSNEARFRADIEAALALARALEEDGLSPQQRLRERILRDPVPVVRWRLLLLAEQTDPLVAREIAREAQRDADPSVRCAAALVLEELPALIGAASDLEVHAVVRKRAMEVLQEQGASPAELERLREIHREAITRAKEQR